MVIALMMGMVLITGVTGLMLRQLMSRKLGAAESYQQMAETAALNGFNRILSELNADDDAAYKGYLFTLNHHAGDMNNSGSSKWQWNSSNQDNVPLGDLCTNRRQLPEAVPLSSSSGEPPYVTLTENTSSLIAELLPRYIDPSVVAVVEGGIPETTTLLEQRFDHIFYTGNGHVGRIVMAAAARHLTPVTLELGGKSPVYVHESADLKTTARRVAWGKFLNAGQTCIAPDYVLVEEAVRADFLAELKAAVLSFYGDKPMETKSFARIVSDKHHARLSQLLENERAFVGGVTDPEQRYIAPTILVDVDPDSPVMQAEMFGPILPVLSYEKIEEAIEFIQHRARPLALYLFTEKARERERILRETVSGGVAVNEVLFHCVCGTLPFGGVGASGMGSYHGQAGFDTFSHLKPVFIQPRFNFSFFLVPPITPMKRLFAKIFRKLV